MTTILDVQRSPVDPSRRMPRKRASRPGVAPNGPRQPSHLPSAIVSLVAVVGAFSEASRGQHPLVIVALLLLAATVLIIDAWRSRRSMHDETSDKGGPSSR